MGFPLFKKKKKEVANTGSKFKKFDFFYVDIDVIDISSKLKKID